MTGSWAIFFAALFAAIALFLTKKYYWAPLLTLIAFGWELQRGHPSYDGPIAFSLVTSPDVDAAHTTLASPNPLIISAAWIYFQSEIQPNVDERRQSTYKLTRECHD